MQHEQTIYVIDDDEAVRQSLEFMLKAGITIKYIRPLLGSDRVLEVAHFLFSVNQVGRRAKAFLENRCAFVKVGNLVECADLKAGFACNCSVVGFLDTADDFEECGFAGSIRTDKTNFFGRIYLE